MNNIQQKKFEQFEDDLRLLLVKYNLDAWCRNELLFVQDNSSAASRAIGIDQLAQRI